VALLSGAMVPRDGVAHANVIGVVPVALPPSEKELPEPTIYGPPAFVTGALHATAGLMVTVADTGAETTPLALVATTETVISVGVVTPAGAV